MNEEKKNDLNGTDPESNVPEAQTENIASEEKSTRISQEKPGKSTSPKIVAIIASAVAVVAVAVAVIVVILAGRDSDSGHKHVYGSWTVTGEPTCTEQGTKIRECTKCDEVETEHIAPTGHSYDTEDITWAWQSDSLAHATVRCSNDSSHTKKFDATVTSQLVSEPTCKTEGRITHTATVTIDGEIYHHIREEYIETLEHTVAIVDAVAPSCTSDGLTEGSVCSVCETVLIPQEIVAKLPHTEETIPAKDPTCSEEGLTAGTRCSVCETVLVPQTSIGLLDCTYESAVVAPTCEDEGYTTYTCSMCGDSYAADYVDALGHTYGEWQISGTNTVRYCANDGCRSNQRVMALSAVYSGPVLLIGETIWRDDIAVTATLSDNTTVSIGDFTLTDDIMQTVGNNYVTVTFMTVSTEFSVSAIHDNLPGTTSAFEFTYSEKDNEITITGFIGATTAIVVPAHINRVPVKYIANSAFGNCSSIRSVEIPPSIESIGYRCFSGCSSLNTLKLNEGLKTIDYSAFAGCPITELVIPDSVTSISSYGTNRYGAFEGCNKLVSVKIGNGLKEITAETFKDCTMLETVVIGSGVETIANGAFKNCSSIQSIEIPSNVASIDYDCFSGCSSLKTLKLNEGLKSIGYRAFAGCPITELVIPDSVTSISSYGTNRYGAFEGCNKLVSVKIGNGLKEITAETFKDCTMLKTVVIGSGVEVIANGAFKNCTSLASIKIPAQVQTIDEHAFDGCDSLVIIR